MEYTRETILSDQDRKGYLISSRHARFGRDDVIAVARIGITEDLSLHYKADFDRGNHSRFQRTGASYRVRSGLVLTLDFEFFNGPYNTYFGRWRNNDRVVTMLKWNF